MTSGMLWPVDRPGARFRRRPCVRDSAAQGRLVRRAVRRAQLGDREALGFLYGHYSDNVYSYVRGIVRDDHDAEDVTQQVFAKLITSVGRYEARGVPFVAWLLRLSHNVAIDHLRTRRATPAQDVRGADERSADPTADRGRALQAALATLPDDQRDVVVLRHVLGLSPREIAVRLGRTEGSVNGLHHRGRRALRDELLRLDAAPSVGRGVAA